MCNAKKGRIKGKVEPLTDNEVKAILKAAENSNTFHSKRDYIILRLLAKTGVRLGELRRIRVKDIDFDKGRIFVYKAKRNKQREVMVDSLTLTLVKFWIGDGRIKPHESIWAQENGTVISETTIKRVPSTYARIAGINKVVSCHSFRHYFITYCYRRNMNPEKIRQLVGHENIKITSGYTHLTTEDTVDDYNKIMDGW